MAVFGGVLLSGKKGFPAQLSITVRRFVIILKLWSPKEWIKNVRIHRVPN